MSEVGKAFDPSNILMYNGSLLQSKEFMGKKLSTQEFIEKAQLKHGATYNYTFTEYFGSSKYLNVFCNRHCTTFSIIAGNHLSGKGCPLCAKESFRFKVGATQEYFEKRVKDTHGDRYNLDSAVYVKNNEKVVVSCKEHGNFEIRPIDLYRGSGCKKCADKSIGDKNRATTEEWIAKAIAVHGLKYNYSKAFHTGKIDHICVGCKDCGKDFYPRPSNHLNGTGCPNCTSNGYTSSKPGYIYILVNKDITKIGITNRNPEIRLKEINKNKPGFQIVYSKYYSDGAIPLAIETSLLWTKLMGGKPVLEKFEGSTECFTEVDVDQLIYVTTNSGENLERWNGARPDITNRDDSIADCRLV